MPVSFPYGPTVPANTFAQQYPVEKRNAHRRECQQRSQILRPPLLVVGFDPDNPVDRHLHPPTDRGGVCPGQVVPKWHMQDHHDGDDGSDLQPCCLTPVRRTVDEPAPLTSSSGWANRVSCRPAFTY